MAFVGPSGGGTRLVLHPQKIAQRERAAEAALSRISTSVAIFRAMI